MSFLFTILFILLYSLFYNASRNTGSVAAFSVARRLRTRLTPMRARSNKKNPKVLSPNETEASIAPLMKLASAHFASQALCAMVELGIPDILGNDALSVHQLCLEIGVINKDALGRIMRLLVVEGIVQESLQGKERVYSLTAMGALLQTNGMVSCVLHWTDRPLWNAWLELPDYIADDSRLPFDRANKMSADEYYSKTTAPESLQHANDFVCFISDQEIKSILTGFDWQSMNNKTVLDLGGHYGKVIDGIVQEFPGVRGVCLDLPDVVASAPDMSRIKLVGGDMMDPSTYPDCDAILLKHILDKSMWTDDESVQILNACHKALPAHGKVILAEAVLPDMVQEDDTYKIQFYIDTMFLLVGRKGARTESEWTELAAQASFHVDRITATSTPSCYIIMLAKA